MPQHMPKHIDEMSAHRALCAKAKVDATHDFVKDWTRIGLAHSGVHRIL